MLKHFTKPVVVLMLVLYCSTVAYSQNNDCIKVNIKPIEQKPIEIPFTPGNTNNDFTFNNISPFADLDILENPEGSVLSSCIFKNNSARILNIDTQNGFLTLSNSIGITDSITTNDPGAIRGTCSFSQINNQLFFTGIGPDIFGFDRIYPFTVNEGILNRVTENNIKNFFIPSNLSTALATTPNGKFLVYIQADTLNNNLASIQSIPITSNMALGKSFIGQALAKVTTAGTYIEFVSKPDSDFIFGIFSNIQEGKEGSGDSFAIFKTNQINGTNFILFEFKKDDSRLPDLFSSPEFIGFSGFKFINKDNELYLFISYLENNSIDIVSKLALFKVEARSELAKSISLRQIGEPILTPVKFAPCNENKIFNVSGPLWVDNDTVYITGINTKLITSYFIDWNAITNNTETNKIFKLSSKPLTTIERNTDLILTMDSKFVYIASVGIQEPPDVKISGYEIEKSSVNCTDLKTQLLMAGICSIDNKPPELILNIPNQTVKINQDTILNLNNNFKDEGNITYTLINNPASSFTQINGNIITIHPVNNSQAGTYNITVEAKDEEGLTNITSFNIEVLIEPNPQSTSPTSTTTGGTVILVPPSTSSPTETPPKPSPTNTQPLDTESIPKPQPSSPPTTSDNAQPSDVMLEPILPDLPKLPDIELVPSDSEQNIDINLLDLSGPDQVIIVPDIPQIIFTNEPPQSSSGSIVLSGKVTDCCSCETGNLICNENVVPVCDGGAVRCIGTGSMILACCRGVPEKLVCNGDDLTIKCVEKQDIKKQLLNKLKTDQIPVKTSLTRGAITRGNSGFLINLKSNIKLKESDLNHITHILIDSQKEITVLTSKTFLVGNNKLLVDLTFPELLNEDTYLLVSLLNKEKNKQEVLAKGNLKIVNSLDFKNVSPQSGKKITIKLPIVDKIKVRTVRNSIDGSKIIRLIITGRNFASRLIEVNNKLFISQPFTTNTILSFVDNSKVDILRTRVLTSGNTILVVLRFKGLDITKIPLTISTPKGQIFYNPAQFNVLTNEFERNIKLDLDIKKKDKKK